MVLVLVIIIQDRNNIYINQVAQNDDYIWIKYRNYNR